VCDLDTTGGPSIFKIIGSDTVLVRTFPHLGFTWEEDQCMCERLKTKPEESALLSYTGLLGELEHLKIKTRLIEEKFVRIGRTLQFFLFCELKIFFVKKKFQFAHFIFGDPKRTQKAPSPRYNSGYSSGAR
jgi:hypothetical protein